MKPIIKKALVFVCCGLMTVAVDAKVRKIHQRSTPTKHEVREHHKGAQRPAPQRKTSAKSHQQTKGAPRVGTNPPIPPFQCDLTEVTELIRRIKKCIGSPGDDVCLDTVLGILGDACGDLDISISECLAQIKEKLHFIIDQIGLDCNEQPTINNPDTMFNIPACEGPDIPVINDKENNPMNLPIFKGDDEPSTADNTCDPPRLGTASMQAVADAGGLGVYFDNTNSNLFDGLDLNTGLAEDTVESLCQWIKCTYALALDNHELLRKGLGLIDVNGDNAAPYIAREVFPFEAI